METRDYVILASQRNRVEEHLNKLNKRAERLDLEPISWEYGKAYLEKRSKVDGSTFAMKSGDLVDTLVIPITLVGPFEVKYDGWSFAATLQHLPTGENIIRSIKEGVPERYRSASHNCEHCKVNRYRVDTYVLEKNGEYVQVGSSCIKDFLGGNSPDNIVARANWVAELIGFGDLCDESYGFCNSCGIFHIDTFLTVTSAAIRKYGWLSRTKSNEGFGPSTASVVMNSLCGVTTANVVRQSEITEDDKKLAKEAIEWCEELSDTEAESDYLYNIRAIARTALVERRTSGYAASIIIAYKKACDKEQERNRSRQESEWIGKVKERRVFDNLTLNKILEFYSMYGPSYRYIFKDNVGNVIVWKASTDSHDFVEGNVYSLKGTIKEHGEYKGVKQTVLTRCTLV